MAPGLHAVVRPVSLESRSAMSSTTGPENVAATSFHGGRLVARRLKAHGVPVIFVHPKDMGGVLVELMAEPAEAHP